MSKSDSVSIAKLAMCFDAGANKFELHKQAVAQGWRGDYARARKIELAFYLAQKHFEQPAEQPAEQVRASEQVRNNRAELVAAAHAAASAAVAILSLLSTEQ